MTNKLVLRTQKNQVFEMLKQATLDPSLFEWTEVASKLRRELIVSCLVHKLSNYYFRFDFTSGDGHYCEYSPGRDSSIEKGNPGSWLLQIQYVGHWIQYLKREIETPDFWVEAKKESELSRIAESEKLANTSFDLNELKKVAVALAEIKNYLIANHAESQEERAFIENKISYLEEASKRLGRKDWLNVAISIFVTFGFKYGPDLAREIFRLAATYLHDLYKTILMLT